MASEVRQWCGVVGMLFAPVLFTFAWLWVAGKVHYRNQFFVLLIPYFGVGIGYVSTLLLPMRWYWRIGLFLLYVPVQMVAVYLAVISYVCGGYGASLGLNNIGCP